MVKKAKHRRAVRRPRPVRPVANNPSDRGEVVTVMWMLALSATLLSEGLGILIRLFALQAGISARLQLLSGTLLTVALLSGLVTLVLTPVTLKLRRVPPPPPVVVSAVVAGIVPILTAWMLTMR
jgi:hypothetical protein